MRAIPAAVRPFARKMSERALQENIISTAHLLGYWMHHQPDSRRSTRGLPDLVMVGKQGTDVEGRLIYIECKTDRGTVTIDQGLVIHWLLLAGAEAYVMRPRHWLAEVVAPILRGDEGYRGQDAYDALHYYFPRRRNENVGTSRG